MNVLIETKPDLDEKLHEHAMAVVLSESARQGPDFGFDR
jgi:hypothetical protein